ncbi:MAG: mechanosensitive ion channel [Gammaproteobacteria bacterium]
MSELIRTAIEFGSNVLAAIVILIVGLWASKRIAAVVEKSLHKAKLDITLSVFLSKLSYLALIAFSVIAALSRVGIQTASFVAVLAAAGLAIGMALQGSLSNFAAGVMILIFRPFKQDDWVDAGGVSGAIKEINVFFTVLATGDNKKVIVPNSQMTGGSITNYSAYGTRRVDLVIGVSYNANLAATRQVIHSVLAQHPNILHEKEYTIAISELGASSVNFTVRSWVNSSNYWPTYFDLNEQIKNALDANNISIPFPQMDVHLNPSVEAAFAAQQRNPSAQSQNN